MSVPPGAGADPNAWPRAVSALQAGRLAEAEKAFRSLLADAPANAEAVHLLGVAVSRQGRIEEGLALLDRAVTLMPQNAACLHNRAQALVAAGRAADARRDLERAVALAPQFDAGWNALGNVAALQGDGENAERHYRKSLALRPANPDAHYNLAVLLQAQGRLDEAIAGYRRALAERPAFPAAHNNLGNSLTLSGRREEALAHYAEAVRLDPQLADALANLGQALREAGRIDEAVTVLERAARIRPDSPDILNNLGIAYFARNRFTDAEACYRKALAVRPRFHEALNNLANALASQARNDEAMALYREVIEIAPGYADAHSNLGLQFQESGDIEAAMACYGRALALAPDHSDALNNQGYLLQEQGRRDDAMALYRRALEANPRSARAAHNLGLAHLCRHEFAEGWPATEQRYFTTPPVAVARAFPIPRFTAADWGRGHTLAVWREQGLGDQMLYATLLPELEARGQDFVLEIDPRLSPALVRSHPRWRVVSPAESAAAFAACQRHIALGSLAALLRTAVADFARQPRALLQADPARIEGYRARLAAGGRRTIGIAWRSFQPQARGFLQRKKTAPLAAFLGLSKRGDVKLLDLQYGDTAADRAQFAALGGRLEHLEDLDLFNDVDGVLAAVCACDLVVTTSNVTAHYAGILGREAWLLYPSDNPPFHYWAPDAEGRCLWYPSVRIITGKSLATWEQLLGRVHERLDA